jgi:hypothetical protein
MSPVIAIVRPVANLVAVPALPVTLPAIAAVTVRPVSVPTLVIFGCAAVVTVAAVVDVLALPVNAPVNVLAVTPFVTANDVNVPTLVILGCAAVVTVAAVVAVLALPVKAPTNVGAVIVLDDEIVPIFDKLREPSIIVVPDMATAPDTSNFCCGFVLPIPTFPPSAIRNTGVVVLTSLSKKSAITPFPPIVDW